MSTLSKEKSIIVLEGKEAINIIGIRKVKTKERKEPNDLIG